MWTWWVSFTSTRQGSLMEEGSMFARQNLLSFCTCATSTIGVSKEATLTTRRNGKGIQHFGGLWSLKLDLWRLESMQCERDVNMLIFSAAWEQVMVAQWQDDILRQHNQERQWCHNAFVHHFCFLFMFLSLRISACSEWLLKSCALASCLPIPPYVNKHNLNTISDVLNDLSFLDSRRVFE